VQKDSSDSNHYVVSVSEHVHVPTAYNVFALLRVMSSLLTDLWKWSILQCWDQWKCL